MSAVLLVIVSALVVTESLVILVPEQSWIDKNIGANALAPWRALASRSLDLRGTAVGDSAKLASLTGRDFSNANFEGARLTNVELIDSVLDGARFQRAILKKVQILCTRPYDKLFDENGCSLDTLDMSQSTLVDFRIENFGVRQLDLHSATLINSRMLVDVTTANLSDANLWASRLGFSDRVLTSEPQRTFEWLYLGGATLVDSRLYARQMSGAMRLAFAHRSRILMVESDGNSALQGSQDVELGRYFGTHDHTPAQRKLAYALEPHMDSKDYVPIIADHDTKGEKKQTEIRCRLPPSDEKEPDMQVRAELCLGRTGYDIRKSRAFGHTGFIQALKQIERSCPKPHTDAAKLVLKSFLDNVLIEQIVGRELTALLRPLPRSVPTQRKVSDTIAARSKERLEYAKASLESLAQRTPEQILEARAIWRAIKEQPCICQALTSENDTDFLPTPTAMAFENVMASFQAIDKKEYLRAEQYEFCRRQ